MVTDPCGDQVWNSCKTQVWDDCATQVWNDCASQEWNSCKTQVWDDCATQVWDPQKTLNPGWSKLWEYMMTYGYSNWTNWDVNAPASVQDRQIENKEQTRTRQILQDWSGNKFPDYVTEEELTTQLGKNLEEIKADPTKQVLTVVKYRYRRNVTDL